MTGKQVVIKLKWGMEYKGTYLFLITGVYETQISQIHKVIFSSYVEYRLSSFIKLSILFLYGIIYIGILVSADSYMNFQLANSEEYIDGQYAGNLGEILIRCNNVLYVREVPPSSISVSSSSSHTTSTNTTQTARPRTEQNTMSDE